MAPILPPRPPCLVILAVLFAVGMPGAASAAGLSARQVADPDFRASEAALQQAVRTPERKTRARNVILFIGDGMGVSTVTAARIFEGQARGVDGASNRLAFEQLPYAAFSKTYSQDALVTDSANGATALLTGVKTLNGVVSLDGSAKRGDCASAAGAKVTTLAELAKASGLATGVVTTTRLTDATPAAVYAHAPQRNWESDADMPAAALQAGCVDIARQLIEAGAGKPDVVLGGGRGKFTPVEAGGERKDGRDLIDTWRHGSTGRVATPSTGAELSALDPTAADSLLGIFGSDNLPYAGAVSGPEAPPSLTQMTSAAIAVLARKPRGYFLVVEGGNIDKAHHRNDAFHALGETAELSRAVAAAMASVDMSDTLIIVTADHSHGLVISGYPPRSTSILGEVPTLDGGEARARDGKAYGVLSYASGPGGDRTAKDGEGDRAKAPRQALVPMSSAAHSGEDVPVYAGGPGAQFIRGVIDQTYIFQVIRAALGLGGRG